MNVIKQNMGRRIYLTIFFVLAALLVSAIGGQELAKMGPPTKDEGLSFEKFGEVSEDSLKATVGLEGHVLQLRAFKIEAGGQIRKHSHKDHPGLLKVIDGAWVEGRESGESTFEGNTSKTIIQDETTIHWFYNRGNTPATAIECVIIPTT